AKGHPEYYQDLGQQIAKDQGAYFINQFGNADNPLAHQSTTGPEIWEQMNGELDAVVVGVGSSGTISGLSEYFRSIDSGVKMVLADPKGSVLVNYIKTGELGQKGSWLVEGIGEDFIPPICDLSEIGAAYTISDDESFSAARELLLSEGLLAGSSSGTLLAAALKYCREQTEPKNVVSFACDTGNKYLSKLYNDFWLEDQGFVQHKPFGDLRDLIGRRHDERATIVVGPSDVLTTAHNRLRNAGISQLPVMDDGHLVGVLTEDDIMRYAFGKPELLNSPVADAMQSSFVTLDKSTPVNNLVAMLEVRSCAAILDGRRFLGLVTRSDVLNHLRKQMSGDVAPIP
ncbi:MAG: pyridoxal-phosphate dependent enzyme, partial [Pseudomonadota bacterium]